MAETAQYEKRRAKVAAAAAKDRHLRILRNAVVTWLSPAGEVVTITAIDDWTFRLFALAESMTPKRKTPGVPVDHQAMSRNVMRVANAVRKW